MKFCLLLLLYVFSPYSHGSEFNLSFYPDKAVVNYPVFKKKEEYGSAKLEINNLIHNVIKTFYLLEDKSSLKINNEVYKPNSNNLKSKLY